ncbi:MAG: hypothetical protein COT85_01210 [Chlamydiae bacterium CG10_big_fil_rev_8_21_14_0_10_42_34]|nr:MAG: hypothetical protein COT85_01210 [Chlamydiae bacterium CG10_big_fil_rev_8_21_14_0_10_42_34]
MRIFLASRIICHNPLLQLECNLSKAKQMICNLNDYCDAIKKTIKEWEKGELNQKSLRKIKNAYSQFLLQLLALKQHYEINSALCISLVKSGKINPARHNGTAFQKAIGKEGRKLTKFLEMAKKVRKTIRSLSQMQKLI